MLIGKENGRGDNEVENCRRGRRATGKTRYQKILEDYFQKDGKLCNAMGKIVVPAVSTAHLTNTGKTLNDDIKTLNSARTIPVKIAR